MRKIFFIIILACIAALNIHAQDNRFVYSDTALLKESQTKEEHNNGAVQENSAVLKESQSKEEHENAVVQENYEEEKDILSDTTVYINHIVISPDTVNRWKANRRFAYMKSIDSLLKKKQQEELDALKKVSNSRPNNFFDKLFSSGIMQIFFWAIAIAFVLFILYKLFLSNGIFKRGAAASSMVNEVAEEELVANVSDYDKLIHQSVKLGDHRMAVRYLFLKTLRHLADKEYVQHSADKTNYQYVQEIRSDRKNEFASLVLNYEYVWYGNFSLNAEMFTGIEKKFTSFNTKIQ